MSELRGVIEEALEVGKSKSDIIQTIKGQGFSEATISEAWPTDVVCPIDADEPGAGQVPTVNEEPDEEVSEEKRAVQDESHEKKEGDEESPPSEELGSQESNGKESESEDETPTDENEDSENTESSNEKESDDEYSREDDVLTQEDFEEIEEEEDNKGIVASVTSFFTSDEEGDGDDGDEEDQVDILQRSELSRRLDKAEDSIEDIEIDVSKIDGRIDVLSEKQETVTDSIDGVREKVGELRSTVLGRERSFNQLQEDFRKIKLIVDNFDQDVLDSKFDNITTKQTKLSSTVERLQSQLEQTRKKLEEYQSIMKKIKDYDNLLDKLDEVKEIKKEISSMKVDVEKSSTKAEVMVHDVQDSLKKMKEAHSLASTNEETIRDMTQDVSKLEAKTEGLVKKEKFEDLKADVEVMKENLFNQDFQK